jgi:hypothetical protein
VSRFCARLLAVLACFSLKPTLLLPRLRARNVCARPTAAALIASRRSPFSPIAARRANETTDGPGNSNDRCCCGLPRRQLGAAARNSARRPPTADHIPPPPIDSTVSPHDHAATEGGPSIRPTPRVIFSIALETAPRRARAFFRSIVLQSGVL